MMSIKYKGAMRPIKQVIALKAAEAEKLAKATQVVETKISDEAQEVKSKKKKTTKANEA